MPYHDIYLNYLRLKSLANREDYNSPRHIEADELEDMYIAEQRLADIRAGRSNVFSSAEVEALLDMES